MDGKTQTVFFVVYGGEWANELNEFNELEHIFKRSKVDRNGYMIRDVLPEDNEMLVAMIKAVLIEEYNYTESEFINV